MKFPRARALTHICGRYFRTTLCNYLLVRSGCGDNAVKRDEYARSRVRGHIKKHTRAFLSFALVVCIVNRSLHESVIPGRAPYYLYHRHK